MVLRLAAVPLSRAAALVWLALAVLSLGACAPKFTDEVCVTESDCFRGQTCEDNRCVDVPEENNPGGPDASADAGGDTSTEPGDANTPDADSGLSDAEREDADAGEDEPRPEPGTVTTVTLTPEAATLTVGQTVQLYVTLRDIYNARLEGRTVTWTSSDEAVATVNTSGLVTAVYPGTALIEAESEGVRAAVTITVTPRNVTRIALSPTSASIIQEESVQLVASARGGNDVELPEIVLAWESLDPGVAEVSDTGLVTGLSPGQATIRATGGTRSATSVVTVLSIPANTVTIAPTQASLVIGQTVQLAVTVRDGSGRELQGRLVSYQSSHPFKVSISPTGLVTALEEGAVTITASVEGKTASSTLTISAPPVDRVEILPASAQVPVGQTAQLLVSALSANGTPLGSRTFTFSSSSPSVAVVSNSGLITGVSLGQTTISATCEGRTSSIPVTVIVPPVASVTPSAAPQTIEVGQSTTVSVVLRDALNQVLNGRAVTYTSLQPAIATANAQGVVQGLSIGQATIRAQSENASGTIVITVTRPSIARLVLEPASVELPLGDVTTLSVTAYSATDEVLDDRIVVWRSDNLDVARVDFNGRVTTHAIGQAVIEAEVEGIVRRCEVEVLARPAQTASVDPDRATLEINDTIALAVTAYDDQGGVVTTSLVDWISLDPEVATVDPDGVVTAHGLGTAVIEAHVDDAVAVFDLTVVFPVASVVAGEGHSCLRTLGGRVYCWGSNGEGQLGTGDFLDAFVATQVNTTARFDSLAVGLGLHTCGVTAQGEAYCWGDNAMNQIGTGPAAQATPRLVSPGFVVGRMALGYGHTCALGTQGALACWGDNSLGQLGDGSFESSAAPRVVAQGERATGETFAQIATGWAHTCALSTSQKVYCWGDNTMGQIGADPALAPELTEPTLVALVGTPVGVTAGADFSCAWMQGGALYCWGGNLMGQLGENPFVLSSSSTPVEVSLNASVAEASAGGYHICARTNVSELYCWGNNDLGQLGTAEEDMFQPLPMRVGASQNMLFLTAEAGLSHTCAATPMGDAYCWGDNTYAQLGDDSGQPSDVPVMVLTP